MSATPSTDELIRDARGRAAVVGRGTGTGKAYLDLADGLVELQRRAEKAEARAEDIAGIAKVLGDHRRKLGVRDLRDHCTCGWVSVGEGLGLSLRHHQAALIAVWFLSETAP